MKTSWVRVVSAEGEALGFGHCPTFEHHLTRFGDPGHQIAQYAEEAKADLIVLPSHGRSGLQRLLIGSVAERVVRHAPCPVLVVRGRCDNKPKDGE